MVSWKWLLLGPYYSVFVLERRLKHGQCFIIEFCSLNHDYRLPGGVSAMMGDWPYPSTLQGSFCNPCDLEP
jgi:hypothetical protein